MEVDRCEASKAFFFEKKKQKTFVSAVAVLSGERATAETKVFCFFSSEKKALLFLPDVDTEGSKAAGISPRRRGWLNDTPNATDACSSA